MCWDVVDIYMVTIRFQAATRIYLYLRAACWILIKTICILETLAKNFKFITFLAALVA